MENTNYYILTAILDYPKSVSYDTLLKIADIKSLEQRRQFLIISYFCTSVCRIREHYLVSVSF